MRDTARQYALVLVGPNLPPSVALPTPIEGQTGIVDVAAGGGHTCTLRVDGEVQCWGLGELGQLGDGVLADRSVASQLDFGGPVRDVAVTEGRTCVLLRSGRISCLDYYSHESTVSAPNAQRLIQDEYGVCALAGDRLICWDTAVENGAEAQVREVSSGVVTAARGGGVACWTTAEDAYCRAMSAEHRGLLYDMQIPRSQMEPVRVPELAGAQRLAIGQRHGCAIRRDGAVACWGSNRSGQLGNGTSARRARWWPRCPRLPAISRSGPGTPAPR